MKIIQYLRSGLGLLLLSVFGFQASAQEIHLDIPDSSGMEGTELVIPVRISHTGDPVDIYSYEMELSYVTSRLNAIEVITDGSVTETFGEIASNTSQAGTVLVAAAGSAPLITDGVLFYVRFELLSPVFGTNISFNTSESFFNEKGTVEATFDNGRISIQSLPSFNVSPTSRTLFAGDSLSMSVSFGTGPVDWHSYDPAVASVDENGMVRALDYGTTEIWAVDTNGVRNSNTSFIDVRHLMLTFEDHVIYQGNEVSIPVYLDNPNQVEVLSGTLEMTWNSNVVTGYDVIKTGSLLENEYVEHNVSGNRLFLGFATETPLPIEDKPLFFLQLETSPDHSSFSALNVNQGVLNEGFEAYVESGNLRVLSLPNVSISPANPNLVAGDTQLFSASNTTGPVTWVLSDPAIGSIDADGTLTTVSGGRVTVSVQDSIGASASTNNFLVNDTWVRTPDTTFFSGESVELPVRIEDLPDGKPVFSYEMDLSFNADRLTYTGIRDAETLTEGWMTTTGENTSSGSFKLVGAGTTSFSSSGTIVYLQFDVAPGLNNVTASFNISNIVLNEGDPTARLDTPNISITNTLGTPTLVSPSNFSTGIAADGEVVWDAVAGATGYHLQISPDINFDSLIIDVEDIEVASYSYQLEYNTLYFWRVKSVMDDLESAWSNTWRFTTAEEADDPPDPDVPEKIALTSPGNNEQNVVLDVNFQWEADDFASTYQLQIATDDNFDNVTADQTTADTELSVDDLENSTAYYWRVRGVNADTVGAWSDTWEFTTIVALPGTVTLISPVSGNDPLPDGDSVNFQWQALDEADEYEIEVSDDNNFTSILFTDLMDSTSSTFGSFVNGTYYWRVRALNAAGWGDYSTTFFEVDILETSAGPHSEIPHTLALYQNYPNPFNPTSIIRFDLPSAASVKVEVYNTLGQRVSVLADKTYHAGKHKLSFDGASLTSGLYIYRLTVDGKVLTRTMSLVK